MAAGPCPTHPQSSPAPTRTFSVISGLSKRLEAPRTQRGTPAGARRSGRVRAAPAPADLAWPYGLIEWAEAPML